MTIYSLDTSTVCGLSGYDPGSITSAPDGSLWFAGGSIGRITTSGLLTAVYPTTHGATTSTFGTDGALWYTTYEAIDRLTTSGSTSTFPIPPADGEPYGITVGPDGALWFVIQRLASEGPGEIGRLTTAGSLTVYTLPSGWFPDNVTTGPDGALWFTVATFPSANGPAVGLVGRMTTSGVITAYYTDPYAIGGSGFDITTGPDEALWLTNTDSVTRITTAGVFTTNYLFSEPPLTGTENIVAGPDGALWFTNYGPTTWVGRITTAGSLTAYSNPGMDETNGIAVGSDGGIWFTNRDDAIGRVTPP